MIKAICVSNNIKNSDMLPPQIGTEYTLNKCQRHIDHFVVSELMRAKTGHMCSYHKKYFAPLNGPCEKERLEEWQTERLTKADKMLQALAEEMPEVEMPKEGFERVWNNVKATL